MIYSNAHYQGPYRLAMYGKDIIEKWISYDYYKLCIDLNTFQQSHPSTDILISDKWTKDYLLYLYNKVGRDYSWWYMNYMENVELDAFLSGNKSFITLISNGEPAGFCIINFDNNNVEYFGLLPDFINQGLGKSFLKDCVSHACCRTKKLWLYTTNFDHPRALAIYKSIGFNIIEHRHVSEYYPVHCL